MSIWIKIIIVVLTCELLKAGIYYIIRKRQWEKSQLGRNLKAKMEDYNKVNDPASM